MRQREAMLPTSKHPLTLRNLRTLIEREERLNLTSYCLKRRHQQRLHFPPLLQGHERVRSNAVNHRFTSLSGQCMWADNASEAPRSQALPPSSLKTYLKARKLYRLIDYLLVVTKISWLYLLELFVYFAKSGAKLQEKYKTRNGKLNCLCYNHYFAISVLDCTTTMKYPYNYGLKCQVICLTNYLNWWNKSKFHTTLLALARAFSHRPTLWRYH